MDVDVDEQLWWGAGVIGTLRRMRVVTDGNDCGQQSLE